MILEIIIISCWLLLGFGYLIYWRRKFVKIGTFSDSALSEIFVGVLLILVAPLFVLLELELYLRTRELDKQAEKEAQQWEEQREAMFNAWKEKQTEQNNK